MLVTGLWLRVPHPPEAGAAATNTSGREKGGTGRGTFKQGPWYLIRAVQGLHISICGVQYKRRPLLQYPWAVGVAYWRS